MRQVELHLDKRKLKRYIFNETSGNTYIYLLQYIMLLNDEHKNNKLFSQNQYKSNDPWV